MRTIFLSNVVFITAQANDWAQFGSLIAFIYPVINKISEKNIAFSKVMKSPKCLLFTENIKCVLTSALRLINSFYQYLNSLFTQTIKANLFKIFHNIFSIRSNLCIKPNKPFWLLYIFKTQHYIYQNFIQHDVHLKFLFLWFFFSFFPIFFLFFFNNFFSIQFKNFKCECTAISKSPVAMHRLNKTRISVTNKTQQLFFFH